MRVIHICFKFQLFFPIYSFYSLKYPFKWLILVVFCCYHQVGSHRLRTLFFKKQSSSCLFARRRTDLIYVNQTFLDVFSSRKKEERETNKKWNEKFNRNSTQLFLNMVLIWIKTKLRTCQRNRNNHSNSNNTTYTKKLVIKNRNAEKYE